MVGWNALPSSCVAVLCQNVLMEWHNSTELFEYLIRRNLEYPFRSWYRRTEKLPTDLYRSPCLPRTYWVHIEISEFKNGFLFTTESCIFALFGAFTTCTVAWKLYVCHCLAVIRPTDHVQNCSSVKTQFVCWMNCAASLLPLLFLIASLVSPYSVHELRERCAAFPEDCIR